jgi:hypothetical protein
MSMTEIRQEILPIVIVAALLAGALRYWLLGMGVPDDLQTLVTAVTMFYFGSRTGAAAATRAINGSIVAAHTGTEH